MDQMTIAMTSLKKRLMLKGTRRYIEYNKQSVYNAPIPTKNAVIFTASKVEDNAVCIITVLVIVI